MRIGRRLRAGIVTVTAVMAVVAQAHGRAIGDSEVVARVPAPGFPEGIAVHDGHVWVSGPAQFGHRGESKLWAFNLQTGALAREVTIEGITPGYEEQDHGISGIAFDAAGRLYVLDIQQGILRIHADGTQERYTPPFPDLPPCTVLSSYEPGPCSPAFGDAPPLPNDMVFDADGTAYVSDSLQATIWRVPPGGGQPQIWYQDRRFDTAPIGANGVRIRNGSLYVAVTGNGVIPGRVYTLPLVDEPEPADLAVFHQYFHEGPDGLAFGASGHMYVALAYGHQISVLDPSGAEVQRFAGPSRDGDAEMPWDMPANLAFDDAGRRLLAVNHALFDGALLPDRFVVFDLYVDDIADGPARPVVP